jgi:hypothetical protein
MNRKFNIGDKVKHLNDIKRPVGTVIYVFEENKYIEQPNGEKILFASPGDVTVNFNNPVNHNTGKVLNIIELEKI